MPLLLGVGEGLKGLLLCGGGNKKKANLDVITSIADRDRHITMRFVWVRDTKYRLLAGVTVGLIRDTLNCSLIDQNTGAYFSMTSQNK